jgi:hypothetical protein
MMQAATQSAMTMEAFRASQEFKALTQKQQKWVNLFVETQDGGLATREAYGDETSPEYRSMLTRKIETSPRMLAALDLYFQRTPRDRFVRDLENDVRRAKGVAKIQARRLLGQALGLIDGSFGDIDAGTVEGPEMRADQIRGMKIGSIVRVDGASYRVSKVDADGRPLEGDPV